MKQLCSIQDEFRKGVEKTPWTFKKVHPKGVECIRESIDYFARYGMETCSREVGKFNKKERARIDKEMKEQKEAADKVREDSRV